MILLSTQERRAPAFSRSLAPKSILAWSLLFMTTSCLARVDGPIVADDPPVVNRPPAIVPGQVSPPEGIVTLNANCAQHQFQLGVIEEQDLQDRIFVRWFIDYDAETRPFVVQDNLLGSEQTDTAREAPSFILEPQSPRQFPNSILIAPDGYHRLEAWVSDRNFEPGDPPNRRVPDEARVDHAWWLIRFTDDTPCPDGSGTP